MKKFFIAIYIILSIVICIPTLITYYGLKEDYQQIGDSINMIISISGINNIDNIKSHLDTIDEENQLILKKLTEIKEKKNYINRESCNSLKLGINITYIENTYGKANHYSESEDEYIGKTEFLTYIGESGFCLLSLNNGKLNYKSWTQTNK